MPIETEGSGELFGEVAATERAHDQVPAERLLEREVPFDDGQARACRCATASVAPAL